MCAWWIPICNEILENVQIIDDRCTGLDKAILKYYISDDDCKYQVDINWKYNNTLVICRDTSRRNSFKIVFFNIDDEEISDSKLYDIEAVKKIVDSRDNCGEILAYCRWDNVKLKQWTPYDLPIS